MGFSVFSGEVEANTLSPSLARQKLGGILVRESGTEEIEEHKETA